MASRIITKKGSGAPLASDLVHGELAVDTVNKRLYTENAGGTVIEVGISPSTIDINAGTIDGTVIGGSSAAAGTFTSLTATSADVNGTVTADGLVVGTTSDAYSAIYITSSISGESELRMGDTDTDAGSIAYTNSDDTMTFRAAAGARMSLDSSGLDVTGTVTADGLTVDGNGSLLTLDNGSNPATISNTNGNITTDFDTSNAGRNYTIQANSVNAFRIANGGDISFYEDTGTTAKFYWDASAETLTVGGLTVDGTATINDTSATPLVIQRNGGTDANTSIHYEQNTYNTYVGTGNSGAFVVGNGADLGSSRRFAIEQNNDISFYDTSGNAKFFWNASAESLGIGTTSPATQVELSSTASAVLRLSTSDTSVAENQEIGALEYYQADASGAGAGVKASIRAKADNDTAAQTYLAFHTSSSSANDNEAMRIDSSGNVGIGTDSPAQMLELSANNGLSGVANVLRFNDSDVGVTAAQPTGRIEFVENDGGDATVSAYLEVETAGTSGGGEMTFGTGTAGVTATERMRIDSAGNLLVGKTTSSASTVGVEARANGKTVSTVDDDYCIRANRLTGDGDILDFQKDGSSVGSIGTGAGALGIGQGTGNLGFFNANVVPMGNTSGGASDGVINLGAAGRRFKDLYLSGGVYLGGTGAANLLDDYETGTWTPVYIPSGGSFTSITMDTPDCQYIKIGNMVTVSGIIRTDEVTIGAATGNVLISGLPFTANGWGACSIGRAQDFAGDVPMAGYVGGNSSNINLYYRTAANGSTTALSISDLQTGTVANANYIFIECTYYTTA
jgi:hypothetical protein